MHHPNTVTRDPTTQVAHLHELKDGSQHALLAPADAKILIDRGWGEAHLLAGKKNVGSESVGLRASPGCCVTRESPGC